jgi:hypothetical protein
MTQMYAIPQWIPLNKLEFEALLNRTDNPFITMSKTEEVIMGHLDVDHGGLQTPYLVNH